MHTFADLLSGEEFEFQALQSLKQPIRLARLFAKLMIANVGNHVGRQARGLGAILSKC